MYLQVQLSLNQIIIYFRIDLAILQEKQKEYFWNKPDCCPLCQNTKLWGHGYVYRYFDDFPDALPLKRYRCPNCGAVHTMRPDGYHPRFSASLSLIFFCLLCKILNRRWLKIVSRQRQQYWYKGFEKQCARISLSHDPLEFLLRSYLKGYPFASHSLVSNVKSASIHPPYLIFAATDPQIPP